MKRKIDPLFVSEESAGANEMPITSVGMRPWEKALSTTVEMDAVVSGKSVSTVRSAGPTPMTPSTPLPQRKKVRDRKLPKNENTNEKP